MTAKRILFDDEARSAVRKGADLLAKAVAATLGPRGRLCLVGKSYGSPNATKDGAAVAKEILLPDPFENMGAALLREVASEVGDDTGDGTTTATILASEILAQGLRHLGSGANVAALKRGIDRAVSAAVDELAKHSVPVDGADDYRRVATIASNGDTEAGDALAEIFEKRGKDAVVTIEDGKSLGLDVAYSEGMEFDRGWLSAYFVTDAATQRTELVNARVLIHEKKISAATDLLPILERCAGDGVPLLIIAEDIEAEALALLVVNKMRGILQCAAVKAPGFGDRRTAMLHDLAVLTGAQPVMEGLGRKLDQVTMEELGTASRIVIDKGNTQIIGGGGERSALQGRCALIRKELSEAKSTYDKDKLEERLAKLEGGVVELLVGGATESEVKERKSRLEDALAAVRAAAEEGLVIGGGTALIRAEGVVAKLKLEGDEALGARAVHAALSGVVRTLATNAGENPGVIAERVRDAKNGEGFNALTGEIEDLAKAGVVDPTKVLRSALQHAASVGTTLISLDAAIAESPDA